MFEVSILVTVLVVYLNIRMVHFGGVLVMVGFCS